MVVVVRLPDVNCAALSRAALSCTGFPHHVALCWHVELGGADPAGGNPNRVVLIRLLCPCCEAYAGAGGVHWIGLSGSGRCDFVPALLTGLLVELL